MFHQALPYVFILQDCFFLVENGKIYSAHGFSNELAKGKDRHVRLGSALGWNPASVGH